MAATVTGNGYYLMSTTGTIYCFGDARYFGNKANLGGGKLFGRGKP